MNKRRSLSDHDLFALVREGDHAAYTELYQRYSGLLYNFAYKLTADGDAARDLLQEVFIALWDNRNEITLTGALNAYLYTAIRYQFLKNVAHQKIKNAYAERFIKEAELAEDIADLEVTEQELIKKVELLLAQLPPKMARILAMSRLEQRSNAEIAEEMGLSEKTIKNLKTQAIRNLRLKIGLLSALLFLAGR